MEDEGLNTTETYLYFVNRHAEIVKANARKPIMWNDAYDEFESEIDEDTTIMFWTIEDGGNKFRNALRGGYNVISAAANPLYLSNSGDYNSKEATRALGCDVTPLEDQEKHSECLPLYCG